jgi:hypothetical protein
MSERIENYNSSDVYIPSDQRIYKEDWFNEN